MHSAFHTGAARTCGVHVRAARSSAVGRVEDVAGLLDEGRDVHAVHPPPQLDTVDAEPLDVVLAGNGSHQHEQLVLVTKGGEAELGGGDAVVGSVERREDVDAALGVLRDGEVGVALAPGQRIQQLLNHHVHLAHPVEAQGNVLLNLAADRGDAEDETEHSVFSLMCECRVPRQATPLDDKHHITIFTPECQYFYLYPSVVC